MTLCQRCFRCGPPCPSTPPHSQEELGLGPNGGLVYCLDYLEQNLDWLREQLAPLEAGVCGQFTGGGAAGGWLVGVWEAGLMRVARLPGTAAAAAIPPRCTEGCWLATLHRGSLAPNN